MRRPLFSIITSCLDAQQYLPRMLGSLARQTCRDFEVVLAADDLGDYSHFGATTVVTTGKRASGAGNARNTAVAAARGDFIVMLDADDELEDSYLENARSVLLRRSSGIVVGPTRVVSAGGDVTTRGAGYRDMAIKEFAWALASLHVIAHRNLHIPWEDTFAEDVLRDAELICRNGGTAPTMAAAYVAHSHAGQMTANVRSEAHTRSAYRGLAERSLDPRVAEVFRVREAANLIFDRFGGGLRWYEFFASLEKSRDLRERSIGCLRSQQWATTEAMA